MSLPASLLNATPWDVFSVRQACRAAFLRQVTDGAPRRGGGPESLYRAAVAGVERNGVYATASSESRANDCALSASAPKNKETAGFIDQGVLQIAIGKQF